MTLAETLYQMMQENRLSGQPADLKTGTVTGTEPLEITTNPQMAPLRREVLYLTQAVVEKKIPVLAHTHTVGGAQTEQALGQVACLENGAALPVSDGYITLNRALAVGDRVLLLRVQNGQKFIVLSRIFEGGS